MLKATYSEEAQTITIGTAKGTETISAKQIERNWHGVSHRPDGRARLELQGLAHRLNQFSGFAEAIRAKGGDVPAEEFERFASRHLSLTRRYWHAESGCLSWFVTGPANFPTARNEKRMRSSDKAAKAIMEHLPAAREAIRRRAFPHGEPGGPIRADNPDAPALIRAKIEEYRIAHAKMKAANAALRSVKSGDPGEMAAAIKAATGWPLALCAKAVQPDFAGRTGFPDFQLSGALAEIKRLEIRLSNIERNRDRGEVRRTVTTAEGDVEVIEDPDAARVRLIFPGKPSEAARAELKSRGFRWAPSQGAWQRQLTSSGRWAAECVLNKLGAAEGAAA